ncbi:D-aminoacyl-tRNA deacylase [Uliginosibacterium sp. 31-12]|uniref:D-aminoacyl-tRNA deacylase n=1 Tax=Uliginosibacterium sp. 31-12 TaxID=3062781 RepID=UPI0026E24D9B|nr:D-aminoacyl-tRNA deacylase [Uliginosibacterium sp. 31-12]MDO6384972.1 D-aminoacyl-tRNA deacylase [Uliginosibacterium sp. 31-12]
MIALIQRVRSASVHVENRLTGEIGPGLLALIGIQRADDAASTRRLLDKLLAYRVFGDEAGRMNRSLADTGGGLLLVSQFTLAADTKKGTRPSFTPAAPPEEARELFDHFVELARAAHPDVATGEFGADMQVSLVNDGPVTFWLEM